MGWYRCEMMMIIIIIIAIYNWMYQEGPASKILREREG